MNLKDYLEEHKITQASFAKKVGTSPPHMNRIVKGGMTPSIVLMRRIEKATIGQVRMEDLIVKEPSSRLKNEFIE